MDFKFDEATETVLKFLDGIDWDKPDHARMKKQARRMSILTEELREANRKNLDNEEVTLKLAESTMLMNQLACHLVTLAEKKMKDLKKKIDNR